MELKSCPFCASDYIYVSQIGRHHWNVGCKKCRCEMTHFGDEAQAIKAWNTRADGWISVEDRLPEVAGSYLVIWDSIASQKYPNICSKVDVLFWTGLGWGAPITEKSPILFWMPLPAPPDTGKEE